ncbi:hypothetical protein VNO77_15929 [Canavalia gladiata]|uniref:Uncharacterized protein n=1 Tax=Canavalia gladiata TaxID=3824 RepID=A0AAN9M027_CANGL
MDSISIFMVTVIYSFVSQQWTLRTLSLRVRVYVHPSRIPFPVNSFVITFLFSWKGHAILVHDPFYFKCAYVLLYFQCSALSCPNSRGKVHIEFSNRKPIHGTALLIFDYLLGLTSHAYLLQYKYCDDVYVAYNTKIDGFGNTAKSCVQATVSTDSVRATMLE